MIVCIVYKLHYWVERQFKIDDAVGAVAVHGYAGFLGVVAAGFLLWGYPSSPDALLGHTEPFARVTPWGQFIGAVIMFFVLGFIPGFILSWILKQVGLLRISREMELAGLDHVSSRHGSPRRGGIACGAPGASRESLARDAATAPRRRRRLNKRDRRSTCPPATFTDWNGNIFDIGPIYPFVGWEVLMVIILVVFWIGWHIVQMRMENADDEAAARRLAEGNNLAKALEDEHIAERM